MTNYGHPSLLLARRIGQRMRILRPMVRLYRRLIDSGYETRFDDALMRSIKAGDTVWDVGANIGIYTKKFAEAVSPAGMVVAFEPTPSTVAELRQHTSSYGQVKIIQVALSDSEGEADFLIGEQNVTNTLAAQGKDGEIIKVKMARGDNLDIGYFPNIIKIDVEGFEIDVVAGLTGILNDVRLRALFIEVHFLEIEKRGLKNGLNKMLETLEKGGLQLEWLDPSHLEAKRK